MLLLAQLVVVVAGLYLVALGVTALVRPLRARRFLEAHATSARVHFTELVLRLTVGVALVNTAPRMLGANLVLMAGWILIGTTLALAVTPWRVHRRFAEWSVPMATRRLSLVAIGAIAGGVAVLAALALGARVE